VGGAVPLLVVYGLNTPTRRGFPLLHFLFNTTVGGAVSLLVVYGFNVTMRRGCPPPCCLRFQCDDEEGVPLIKMYFYI